MIKTRIKACVRHLIKTYKHHSASQLSSLTVLTASFTVILCAMTFALNLEKVLTLWGQDLQASIYLRDEISPESLKALETELSQTPEISKWNFVPKEKALTQFREQMASYAPDLLNDDSLLNVIPSSFHFTLGGAVAPELQTSVLSSIATKLRTFAGVDEVSYGQDWVNDYAKAFQFVERSGLLVILVLSLGAFFVISSSIQSSIQQRKEEIEVLELIGATKMDIRLPFLVEGFVKSAVAFGLALLLTAGLLELSKEFINSQLSYLSLGSQVESLSAWRMQLGLLMAGLTGTMAAYWSLSQLNDGWLAARKGRR